MDAKTGKMTVALMTHQDVEDVCVLLDLLDHILGAVTVEIAGGDGAYDTKQSHPVINARGAQRSISTRDGPMPWLKCTRGRGWRN